MNEKQYLESIVIPLLTKPESLVIDQTSDERGILLTLQANKEDMGRIIGKGGATANSIRILMRQYGATRQLHISVKINDPK